MFATRPNAMFGPTDFTPTPSSNPVRNQSEPPGPSGWVSEPIQACTTRSARTIHSICDFLVAGRVS